MEYSRVLKQALQGVLTGVASFVAVYVAMLIAAAWQLRGSYNAIQDLPIDVNRIVQEAGQELAPEAANVGLWYFFGGHTVPLEVVVGSAFGEEQEFIFAVSELAVWSDVLYVIPPVLLVVVGYVSATSLSSESPTSVAQISVPVGVGYVGSAFAAAYVSIWTVNIGVGFIIIAPKFGQLILMTAIYAVVFYLIGGLINAYDVA